MVTPNIKTKVVHSKSQSAWNVVGKTLGMKYKIARIPYVLVDNEEIAFREKKEAFEHAEFISFCFNNSTKILSAIKIP